jgi:C-terminal processing protease CtpA/Prc
MPVLRSIPVALLAFALAAPARAQATPTPAPTPEAQPRLECPGADSLRAVEEAQRQEAERLYEAALSAHDALRDRPDSAGLARYQRVLADYQEAQRAYNRSVNRLMRLEMQCMKATIDSGIVFSISTEPKGWLGVTFSGDFQVTTVNGKSTMRFTEYPVIESVEPASPAEKGGVQTGDVLIAIDGADLVKGAPTFKAVLVPGRHLKLKLKRERSTVERVVVVERRPVVWNPMPAVAPRAPRALEAPEPPEPPEANAWATPLPPVIHLTPLPGGPEGIAVRTWYDNLTVAGAHVQQFAALKEYFGVDSGLLVLSVIPGTPAAAAGLRDGDVITSADGRKVTSPMQLSEAIERTRSRGKATLEIVRQRKKQTLVMKW